MSPLDILRSDGWLPAGEIAERLSVSIGTVYRWRRERFLPSERLGKMLLLKPSDLVRKNLIPRAVGEKLKGGVS